MTDHVEVPGGDEQVRSSAFLELIGPLFVRSDAARPGFHATVAEQHRNTFGGAHAATSPHSSTSPPAAAPAP